MLEQDKLIPSNLRNPESVDGTYYGIDFLSCALRVWQIGENLKKNRRETPEEDYVVGEAVYHLLNTIVKQDRISYFHRDVKNITERAVKEKWPEERVEKHFSAVQKAYGLSNAETIEEINRRFRVEIGIESIPRAILRPDGDKVTSGERGEQLYHFCGIEIVSETEGEEKIEMSGVYDGGIDSISYPLHRLSLIVFSNKPLETNFERGFYLFRGIELSKEIDKHPEIVRALKIKFAEVVRRYADDREGFLKDRKWDGDPNDPTQIEKFLFDFLEDDYLKRRLDKKTYKGFKKAISFIEGEKILGVLGLRVINEKLLDKGDDLCLQTGGYHFENHKEELKKVVIKVETELKELGCEISDTGITNISEIVGRVKKDDAYAKRLTEKWVEIIHFIKKTAFLMDDDLVRWVSCYRIDLINDLFQRALEKARGVVDSDGKEKTDIFAILK